MSLDNLKRISKSIRGWNIQYNTEGRKNLRNRQDIFIIGRHWNSDTPIIPRKDDIDKNQAIINGNVGGGYFLRIKGIGIAIDPGIAFLKNLYVNHNISIADIDFIIITHFHQDHCADIEAIINLSRNFNAKPTILAPNPVCLYLGVLSIIPYHRILSGEEWEIVETDGHNESRILRFEFLPAIHWQTISTDSLIQSGFPTFIDFHLSSVGIYFELLDDIENYTFKRILITGDTLFPVVNTLGTDFLDSIYDLYLSNTRNHINLGFVNIINRREYEQILQTYFLNFLEAYTQERINPELICFHIGSLEKDFIMDNPNFNTMHYSGHHLGVCGILRLLRIINKHSLKCCVITEWGEELSGERKNISKFLEICNRRLLNLQDHEYFQPNEIIPFIPSDINLVFNIKEGLIKCSDHECFHDFKEMKSYEQKNEFLSFQSKIAFPGITDYEKTCNWDI